MVVRWSTVAFATDPSQIEARTSTCGSRVVHPKPYQTPPDHGLLGFRLGVVFRRTRTFAVMDRGGLTIALLFKALQ